MTREEAWTKVSLELKRLITMRSDQRTTNERRCFSVLSLRLHKKLENNQQAWEDLTPEVWVYLEQKIGDLSEWKPLMF